jgi:hypothetical protein
LSVIALASRETSSTPTSTAMRTPPMAGPQAVLSTTTNASSPIAGCRSASTFRGPQSSPRR